MSNEIEAIKDPGLPAHVHRKADHDPAAADRAERQVATMFGISALGTILLIVSYVFIPQDKFVFVPIMGNQNAHQLGLGLGMAISLFFIGMGAIHWAKTLMPDTEVVAQRHEFRSPDSDRKEFVEAVKSGAGAAGLGRRSLRNHLVQPLDFQLCLHCFCFAIWDHFQRRSWKQLRGRQEHFS
jgi:ubiquinol-cytochrome c reductase iron-sulfur subunit